MNSLQKIKSNPAALMAITAVMLFLSALVQEAFIFIALAPMFALLDKKIDIRSIYGILSGLFALGAMTLLMRGISPATGTVFYAIVVMSLFVLYQLMQHITQDRLNKLSLTILVIGIEYLLLKLSAGNWVTFLADSVAEQETWIRWNIYTGYLGASSWILFVNLLFYQAVLKKEKISWVLVIVALLTIILPMLYSFDLTNNAMTKEQVIRFYGGEESGVNKPYKLHGELISRTGAWLSILILIFTFVRAKTKKVAR